MLRYLILCLLIVALILATGISKDLLFKNDIKIKVLRNNFTNTHEHQIRANTVDTLSIEDYYSRGYPLRHSHRVIGLLEEVSSMTKRANKIVISGSSSKIFEDPKNLFSQELINLNRVKELENDVKSVSKVISDNNQVIAGTTDGRMFAEIGYSGVVIPLDQPET